MAVFEALLNCDTATLESLSRVPKPSGYVELLCLHSLLSERSTAAGISNVSNTLDVLLRYIRALRRIVSRRDPSHIPSLQLLLGFRLATHFQYKIVPNGMIYEMMKTNTSSHSLPLPTGEALLVTERALRPMVQECISGIIRRAEMGFNRRLKVWASFTSGEDRVYMAHTRLSAVLQQVLIQDTINSFHSVEEQTKLKR